MAMDTPIQPQVAVIMGSRSDWPTMEHAVNVLSEFSIPHDVQVVSAHRTPKRLVTFSESAYQNGLKVIIAGAGGAAHLPGMVAALTTVPVIGVPIRSRALRGMDSLLSIVQMPGGIPVATVAIGKAGAKNAGLLAVAMLAMQNESLAEQLQCFREQQRDAVLEYPDPRIPLA